ncbi:Hypothetical protein, putative [Bodo saltans]|uniref:Sister chromatid cohesion protein n=1 Tax=Bodo saltans TaxID=75058 RepID=A0A0S4IHB4_BODSA|nr:Hypothetical protein, putative [Bodo saltans]|eukprot:CUE62680.1 Hypothetical protein, putative [Bodo saltans]
MSTKVAKSKPSPVGPTTPAAAKDVSRILKATFLSSASSGVLLSRLLEVHQALDEAHAPYPLEKAFIDELVKKDYLESGNADIQAVVASILADVLRLANATASTSSLPFASTRAGAVLQFFSTVLERIRTGKKPSTALLMHARHTIERLAMSHAFQKLAATTSSNDADDAVDSLFQTFLHDFTSVEEDPSVLSRVAIVLADCIAATQSVSEVQLELLLSAISVVKKNANPVGASIAVAVFRRNEEHLSSAIGSHVTQQYDLGLEELNRVDIAGGDINERRAALKRISGALEVTIELTRVGGQIISQLLPQLQQGLTVDSGDVRLLTARGFSKIFSTSADISRHFLPTYNLFLSRFSDAKPVVRQEMLKFAQSSLVQFPTETNWGYLSPHLEAKLVDGDEGVRRSTISVICELAATEGVASSVPKVLLETIGQRCADKHAKVRAHAAEKLMQLYRGHPNLSWIPDAVFLSIYAEGGVVAIELGLEDMLPPPTKVADGVESARKSRKAKNAKESIAIFDFEVEAQNDGDAEVSDEALRAAAKKSTFIDAFSRLCGDLSEQNLDHLLRLMEKKRNLRQAVKRLFELRADVKRIGNITTPEGKEASNNVVRLLTFLQSITHTKKAEWDTIFRTKDDSVAKAFEAAVGDAAQADGHAAATELVKKLQGRLTGDAFTFVQQGLVRRLFFPVSRVHGEELASRLAVERALPPTKRHGSLRAAACILAAQPPLVTQLFPILVDTLTLEAGRDLSAAESAGQKSPTKGSKAPTKAAVADAQRARQLEAQSHKELLITLLATLTASASIEDSVVTSPTLEQQAKSLIVSVGRMIIQTPFAEIAKSSAKVLCALFPNHPKAFSQLIATLREKLLLVVEGTQPIQPQVASWLKAITVFGTCVQPKIRVHVTESLIEEVTAPILFGAVRSSYQDDPLDAKVKKVDDLLQIPSMSTSIVDACAKLMTRYASQQGGAKAAILIPKVTADLVSAYRETKQLGTGTIGACKKRFAIAKQLIRLVAKPNGSFLDISHEMTIALVLTAEDNSTVRHALQRKIQIQIAKQKSDVRVFALLLLTAISEEHKSGYQHLRSIVHALGDKMRAAQAAGEIPLGDPRARFCYAENAIPTLVLFLAHHTFLPSERESGFLAYQRVWHLLFDELFRNGTNCASFCSEMLRKLKQFDDGLDPDSTSTRIMCDLASKVMIECLGQRSVRADALKPYPGSVMLPTMFVKPRDASRYPADVVYLDASVAISAHPPFKAPLFGATPGKSLGGTTSTSAAPAGNEEEEEEDEDRNNTGVTPRRSLLTAVNEEVDEENISTTRKRGSPPPTIQSPPTPSPPNRKRGRSEEEASPDSEDEDDQDSATIRHTLHAICSPLTLEQFNQKGLKSIKKAVEAALHKKLTQFHIDLILKTLPELRPEE